MPNVGQIIKDRRKQLGLNAETLAERCGVNPTTVYRWEKGDIGNIPSSKIKLIADALLISPIVIVGDYDVPSNPYTLLNKSDREVLIAYHKLDSKTQSIVRQLMDLD